MAECQDCVSVSAVPICSHMLTAAKENVRSGDQRCESAQGKLLTLEIYPGFALISRAPTLLSSHWLRP